MAITSKGTSSPSPDRDAQKLGRPEGAGPSDPKVTPTNLEAKLGRPEGTPADPALPPPPDQAKRPGGQGKGARRR
jgi:hypothetical protein